MARTLLLVGVLALLAIGATAHTCLTFPMMRGAHPDLYPGDEVCYQRTGNCGTLPKGSPTATFVQNVPTTITFQQNLNHFWKPNPGHFDVFVSYDDESTWEDLLNYNISDFPANNMNTQTWFNVPVTFTKTAKSAVLRVRYVSHNQDEVVPANNTDAIFYTCADVEVREQGHWGNGMARPMKAQSSRVQSQPSLDLKDHETPQAKQRKAATATGTKNCKAPSRFRSTGVENDFQSRPVMYHNISYDTVLGAMKWTRSNLELGGTYFMTDYWNLTLVSAGYTPQYIYGLNGPNTCDLYGGDRFFPWQYGPDAGMMFLGNNSEPLYDTMMYAILNSGFTFIAKVPKTAAGDAADYCLPFSQQQGSNMILFDSRQVDRFDPSEFAPPAVCTQHMLPTAGCWKHRLDKKGRNL